MAKRLRHARRRAGVITHILKESGYQDFREGQLPEQPLQLPEQPFEAQFPLSGQPMQVLPALTDL